MIETKVPNKHKPKFYACALAAAAASAAHCVQTETGLRLQPAVFRGGCGCKSFVAGAAKAATSQAQGPESRASIVFLGP